MGSYIPLRQSSRLLIFVMLADPPSSKNNHIHNRHLLGPRPPRLATLQQTRLPERNALRDVLHDLRCFVRAIRSGGICSIFAILYSTSFSSPDVPRMGHHCVAGGDQFFIFGYYSCPMCAIGEGGLGCRFVSDVEVSVGDSICSGR